MKYIDAERLRAEIEKRLKNVRDYMNGAGMRYKGPKYLKAQGKESAYDALLNTIDSLQQENEIVEFTFKGGTYRVNGEEHAFKGGKAKVIILEINQEEGNE